MNTPEQTPDSALMFALQRGLPLVARPFAAVGEPLGLDEAAVLGRIADWFAHGTIRRLGGVFDARRLGFKSVLCAVHPPDTEIDAVAARVVPIRGITHCYRRGWPAELDPTLPCAPTAGAIPSLWFTVTAIQDQFDAHLASIQTAVGPHPLLVLPAKIRFKIDVVFDPNRTHHAQKTHPSISTLHADSGELEPVLLTPAERRVVMVLQDHIPPVPEPFAAVARSAGVSVADLMDMLARWQAQGVMRRVAAIPRHRELGFTANGMCVWSVASGHVKDAGRQLALYPVVTHCYERVVMPGFPYNLFAMIHAQEWVEAVRMFEHMSREIGLPDGRLLFSLKEYKKESMQYFSAD